MEDNKLILIGAYADKDTHNWLKTRTKSKKTNVSKYLLNLIEKDRKHVERRTPEKH